MEDKIRFISAPYRVDRKLYKYYSNIGFAIDCIKRHRVHLDNPHNFNDPFEAKWRFAYYSLLETVKPADSIFDEIFEYIKRLPIHYQMDHHSSILLALVHSDFNTTYGSKKLSIKVAIEEIYKSFSNVDFTFEEFCKDVNEGFSYADGFLRLECKMSCFAEVCDSILMWSYYANSHKGVCLEFDLSKLDVKQPLNRKILNNLTKVHYSPIRSDLQHTIQDQQDLNFLISKSDVWAHEHEWRLICDTEEEYLPFDCVSRVFLGVNFDENMKSYKELEKLCNRYYIDIDRCKLSRDRFTIEFESVYDGRWVQYLEKKKAYAGTP